MLTPDIDKHFSQSLPDIRSMGPMLFDPVWAENDHLSSEIEMLHVIRGTVNLFIGRECFTAGPGETLLVPPKTRHRDEFDLDEGLDIFYCSLTWDLAADYFKYVGNEALQNMPAHRKAEISTLFDQLRADLVEANPAGKLVARARLLTILLLIMREALGQNDDDTNDTDSNLYGAENRRALLQQAKAYMEEHYAECVSLDDIARNLHISPYYLSHLFSEQSDFSLFSYLTNLRMKKAKVLLLDGTFNVSEVGRAVGYRDANYFSKAFKKNVGCSPRDFVANGLKKRQ